MKQTTNLTVEAIIVRAYPSGEADLVLRAIARGQGKISLIAKHARKSTRRFAGSFDLLDRGRFTVSSGSGSLHVIQSFAPLAAYKTIRMDLEKLISASVVCECIDHLTIEHAATDDKHYELLSLMLQAIDEAADTRETLRACFHAVRAILEVSGYLRDQHDTAPSAHQLMKLLEIVEHHSERPLESKKALADIFNSLRKEQAG